MPMNWTPENDRMLLLKIVETHNISVNYNLIADAWPKGGEKPTPRAISERFVKLRKLVGVGTTKTGGGGGRSAATPRAPRISTPSSSAKKRKMTPAKSKKFDSEESDADEHLTEEEDDDDDDDDSDVQEVPATPTPVRKMVQPLSRTPKKPITPRFGDKFSNINGMGMGGSPAGTRIKNEPTDNPFDNNSFSEDRARARSLNAALHRGSFDQLYNDYVGYGLPTTDGSGNDGSARGSSAEMHSSMDGSNDHAMPFHAAFGDRMGNSNGAHDGSFKILPSTGNTSLNSAGNGMSFNETVMSSPFTNGLAEGAEGLNIESPASFNHHGATIPARPQVAPKKPNSRMMPPNMSGPVNTAVRPSVKASERATPVAPAPMQRTPRQASRAAADGVKKFVQAQKDADMEDGERSSIEDSAESEFQGSDDDEYV